MRGLKRTSMLKKMQIEQFVIIDTLEIDLQSGLSILTGETGAGKSILLDAFLMVLGAPADFGAIRQGAEQSIVQMHFAPPAHSAVWELLSCENLASEPQQDIVIRREIARNGSDKTFVNGKPASLPLLKKIGEHLGEIHGQNANHTLFEAANQLKLLDMCGDFSSDLAASVSDAYQQVLRCQKDIADEAAFMEKYSRDLVKFETAVKMMEAASVHEIDYGHIHSEHAKMRTAYETSEAFQEITSCLVASTGAIRMLSACNNALARQQNLDREQLKDLTALLTTALDSARAAGSEANRLAPLYEIDTRPMRAYKQQLDKIDAVAAELELPVEELFPLYKDLSSKVARIRGYRARVTEMEEAIFMAEKHFREQAHLMTQQRIAAGEVLSAEINAELPRLQLPRAEFIVKVEELSERKDVWSEKGFNQIIFMARMNAGMPFSSITETASGGELARLVLAVKIVLQGIQKIPTLVFDEVDVGIGGAAAAALGERIAYVADTTQVIVITHSPQVAAHGDQHLYVSKKMADDTTTSTVRLLARNERIEEISRMLAGAEITGESRAAASSLMDEASAAAVIRRAALQKAG